MAGLNNLMSDTQQTSTTMPSWYDAAQQNIMTQGNAALSAAPTMANTTAQGAINTLQGPNNPFAQAQGTLQQIGSGAANPWITDASGNVTPNTGTAMGGLFKAQQQELDQLLPNYSAPAEAGAIGSGNFGSLRGQTAVQKARGDAFSKLNAAQLQAALTNQQTGVSAGTALGNVGSQGINSAMNVGQAQMNAPFTNVSNYANLLGSMQAPTTTTSQVQLSPLSQAATLANTLQGTGAASGLGSLLFGKAASGNTAATKGLLGTGGLSNVVGGAGTDLWKYIQGVGGATGNTAGTYPLEGGGSLTINPDGSQYIKDASGIGTYYDAGGNPMTSGINSGEPAPDIGGGSNPTDMGGGGWGTGESTDWSSIPTGNAVNNGLADLPDLS